MQIIARYDLTGDLVGQRKNVSTVLACQAVRCDRDLALCDLHGLAANDGLVIRRGNAVPNGVLTCILECRACGLVCLDKACFIEHLIGEVNLCTLDLGRCRNTMFLAVISAFKALCRYREFRICDRKLCACLTSLIICSLGDGRLDDVGACIGRSLFQSLAALIVGVGHIAVAGVAGYGRSICLFAESPALDCNRRSDLRLGDLYCLVADDRLIILCGNAVPDLVNACVSIRRRYGLIRLDKIILGRFLIRNKIVDLGAVDLRRCGDTVCLTVIYAGGTACIY